MKTVQELLELYQLYSDEEIIALYNKLKHHKTLEEKFQDMCSEALHNWRESKENEEIKSKKIGNLQNKLGKSMKYVDYLNERLLELEKLCKRRKIYVNL